MSKNSKFSKSHFPILSITFWKFIFRDIKSMLLDDFSGNPDCATNSLVTSFFLCKLGKKSANESVPCTVCVDDLE